MLCKLDQTKSTGVDGVHPHVLKEYSESISIPISLLFIKCFESGVIPDIWKMANITPIIKKCLRTDALNYRLVSLLSILIKLMEKLIREEMSMHLISQNLISANQHGFVMGKSCATNLIETIHIVSEALNRGFTASIVFLTFLKLLTESQTVYYSSNSKHTVSERSYWTG